MTLAKNLLCASSGVSGAAGACCVPVANCRPNKLGKNPNPAEKVTPPKPGFWWVRGSGAGIFSAVGRFGTSPPAPAVAVARLVTTGNANANLKRGHGAQAHLGSRPSRPRVYNGITVSLETADLQTGHVGCPPSNHCGHEGTRISGIKAEMRPHKPRAQRRTQFMCMSNTYPEQAGPAEDDGEPHVGRKTERQRVRKHRLAHRRARATHQNKCPHRVTTGSSATSKHTLHSNWDGPPVAGSPSQAPGSHAPPLPLTL